VADFTFSVDSAVLGELGERLVPSDHIALSELVKNSYDADATEVTISIYKEEGGMRYVIEDNGCGMTLEEVEKYWMKIGTPHKKEDKRSERFGRLKTGEKGVGRFCVRRLGPHLKLETSARVGQDSDEIEYTEIVFNWEEFESGTDVSKIECEGTTVSRNDGSTGTKLTIWGKTDDTLTQRGFDYLRRQLLMLASHAPNIKEGYEEDIGFNINIEAPNFESKEEPDQIREKFFEAAWGELKGEINNDGRAEYTLISDFTGEVKYKSEEPFEDLNDASFRIAILPQNKDQLRDPKLIAKYVLQKIVEEWGGVYTRFNGFRVYPYGEKENDWLDIEKDKARRLQRTSYDEVFNFAKKFSDNIEPQRSMLSLLSSRGYIGYVDISDHSGPIPKLDRQGFVENQAFQELKDFVRFGIDWSTVHRDRYIKQRRKENLSDEVEGLEKELEKDFSDADEAKDEALNFLDKSVKSLSKNLEPELEKETKSKADKSIDLIKSYFDERESQLHHLRLLASTSTMTLLFAHEVKGMLFSLEDLSSSLDKFKSNLSKKQLKELEDVFNPIKSTKENLSDLLKFTFSLIPSRTDTKKKRLNLESHIEKIVGMFEGILEHYSISVDYSEVSKRIMVGPMLKVELYAPILNVLSNAIKAIIAGTGGKSIKFVARKGENKTSLDVMDTGVGLPEEKYEEAFELFSSDPEGGMYSKLKRQARDEDVMLLGEGTGMGLSISRDILKSNDGDIQFKEPPEGWSTRIELQLPTV
jgi:signal transduction histidine kinase